MSDCVVLVGAVQGAVGFGFPISLVPQFEKAKKMDIKMSASHPVYSTDSGRICPACGKPISNCACKTKGPPPSSGDGIIRIRREVKGRRGKTVTIVCGFESDIGEMKKLAVQLKRLCGTGGSVKDGEIIIQGDHREAIKKKLEQLAFKVKLAGG